MCSPGKPGSGRPSPERPCPEKTYSVKLRPERPGVNFINVFTCSFYDRRSQNCKKLLALLGYMGVKAARKILVKLTPGSNPIK